MSTEPFSVLLVEDNPGDARLFEEMLRDAVALRRHVSVDAAAGTRVYHEPTLEAGIERLAGAPIDVVLLDLALPKSTGIETLTTMLDAAGEVPIVVLTGLNDQRVGAEAIKHGAQDYLVKDDVTSDLLARSIHHSIERRRQERSRRRRREQLAALHTLTQELMDVRSPVELSDYVTEAAEAVLHLPVAAIALYDEAAGQLEPTSTTAAAADVDLAALLDLDGGVGWQAFTRNAVRRCDPEVLDDFDQRDDPAEPLTELSVWPLADHGVLVAGTTTDGGFSRADRDFVETVQGNVTATLDRVDRERELRARERTLATKNEALERLRRINDIIRSIDRALVQASTRQEIESVVCEKLASVGPYELAWIGQHDRLAETVTPRTWAGASADYLDAITVRTDDSPEARGPAGRAVNDLRPYVVNDVRTEESFEPWRDDALARDYRSSISLPLTYEGSLYGVLNVYAGQPDVFDELEQAVLEELADTVSHAINAVESKKALLNQSRTRLEFAVTDTDMRIVEMAHRLDCELVFESYVPRSDGGLRSYFTTRGVDPDDVLEFAHRLPFRGTTLVSTHEEGGVRVCRFEADLTDESLAMTVLEHGGRPISYRVDDDCAIVEVELAADAAVREFVEMFQRRYPEAELLAQRSTSEAPESPTALRGSLTELLTNRQMEAIQTAYFSGFFESPRDRPGTEIADTMGISQPTFNRHLRAAHRRICRRLFDSSDEG